LIAFVGDEKSDLQLTAGSGNRSDVASGVKIVANGQTTANASTWQYQRLEGLKI
jgi:hypothetical protein